MACHLWWNWCRSCRLAGRRMFWVRSCFTRLFMCSSATICSLPPPSFMIGLKFLNWCTFGLGSIAFSSVVEKSANVRSVALHSFDVCMAYLALLSSRSRTFNSSELWSLSRSDALHLSFCTFHHIVSFSDLHFSHFWPFQLNVWGFS